jgi:hypothetical protein
VTSAVDASAALAALALAGVDLGAVVLTGATAAVLVALVVFKDVERGV